MSSSISRYAVMMIFMFSTIYTLGFYYYQATGESFTATGLEERTGTSEALMDQSDSDKSFFRVITENIIGSPLEGLSWFSPFALVKGILISIVPAIIYEPINLLLLRPVGWLGTWITTEWVINKIRGGSES